MSLERRKFSLCSHWYAGREADRGRSGVPGSKRSFRHFIISVRECFPDSSVGKESACNAGDLGSIPGLGRFPGEGKVYPLQYSGLENSMDYSLWGHKESDMTEQLSLRKIQSSFKYIFYCAPVVLQEAFLIYMQRQRH